MAKDAASMGIELFVMDDGWFGKRDKDVSGLGDWFVNEKKLGCTLGELSEQIHALGLQFGIWFEPECVSEDSDLYRAHPDWAKVPAKPPPDPAISWSWTFPEQTCVTIFSSKCVRSWIPQESSI